MDKKINKKKQDISSPLLEELLQGVKDNQERQTLIKAWVALDELDEEKIFPPKTSRELELIFRSTNHCLGVDEQIADDELELLAAAGTNLTSAPPDVPSLHGTREDYSTKENSKKNSLFECNADDTLLEYSSEDDWPKSDEDENVIDHVENVTQNDTDGDTFYFSEVDCVEDIVDFIPRKDIIQFGENVALETMFISVNNIGDIVINFPNATFTLIGVKGNTWGLNSHMDVESMTHKILDLCWINFISN